MNTRAIKIIGLMTLILLLMGCRTDRIRNIYEAPVVTTSGTHSMEDVRDAIVRGGSLLGWQVRPIEPGYIVATLFVRTHTASVDIRYDRNEYNITYADSDNLKYRDGKIHSNYNGWVVRLERSIDNELIQL